MYTYDRSFSRALLISDTSYSLDKLKEEEEEEEGMEEEEEEDSEEDNDEEGEEDEEEESSEKTSKKATSGLKKSAAAICVGVGSFCDPGKLQGMAHFVEHMVFMGSQKYPSENGFDQFVQRSGGYDNAHTDTEATVFYFDSQRKHFKEGLDMFSGFFASPLMKEETMQREREAVDSEFEMALVSVSEKCIDSYDLLPRLS